MILDEILEFLQNYNLCLKEYTEITRKKIDYITCNNIQALQDAMNQEQIYMMKIKNFEKQRIETFEKYGYHSYSLTMLINSISENNKEKFRVVLEETKECVFDIKANNRCIGDLLELKLHIINKALSQKNINNTSTLYKNV